MKRTCYAQSSQIRQIRKKMVEIMQREASTCDLKELVAKFIPEVIGREVTKACTGIYPLQNTFIRKVGDMRSTLKIKQKVKKPFSSKQAALCVRVLVQVKILKAPRFDLVKLMEVHGDYSQDIGPVLEAPAEEPAAAETTEKTE